MTCKYEKDISYFNSIGEIKLYLCEKYNFTNGIRCTPKTQPNCYKNNIKKWKRYNGEKIKDIPNGDVKAFYKLEE